MRLKGTRLGFAFFMHDNDSNDWSAHQEDADNAVPTGKALRCDVVDGVVQHRLRFGGGVDRLYQRQLV